MWQESAELGTDFWDDNEKARLSDRENGCEGAGEYALSQAGIQLSWELCGFIGPQHILLPSVAWHRWRSAGLSSLQPLRC